MSFSPLVLRRSCLLVFLLSLGASSGAPGQLKNAQGQLISPVAFANQDAITTSFVVAPNLAGTAGAAGSSNNNWLKVEVHFGTTTALTKPFLDAVDVKVWIEGRDMTVKNGQGTMGVAVALTGSVTYVNIAPNKDVYGVFYVHPSTLARYSGEGGYEDYDRKFDIHAELSVGGTVMDAINKNKETDVLGWYKPFTVVPGLIYRQDQTPFIVADPDRYPAIKLPAATGP
jgi:hypothetical protein